MLREYLKSIADAIRTKLGSTDTINAQNFPSKVNEVYDKGRTDEWSEFWDDFQLNGTREDYSYAFMGSNTSNWSNITIKPKYNITPTNAARMFRRVRGMFDLTEHFKNLDITLDFSKSTDNSFLFQLSNITRVPIIDCSSVTSSGGLANMFANSAVETIDKLILPDNGIALNRTFNAGNLKNIIFDGVIGVSASFAICPLTVESMKSIITHLKNYAGTSNAGTYTLTLSDTSKTAMAELGTIEEFGGKTYDAYITDIGWNLA